MRRAPLTLYGSAGPLSGSIHHPGDVRVLGSVEPGIEVVAGGNLLVSRDVRDATLIAEGDIVVHGSVSGCRAVVDSIGSTRIRKASDARIRAGGDVLVRVAAERCDIRAGGSVRVIGDPGLLRAGRTHAALAVECYRLESSAGEIPVIEIGRYPFENTPEDIEDRLEFLRSRRRHAEARAAASILDSRRRARELASYRALSRALERRLRRAKRAASADGIPAFRVHAEGRVRARVRMGPVEDALRGMQEQWTGRFHLEQRGEVVQATETEENAHVG